MKYKMSKRLLVNLMAVVMVVSLTSAAVVKYFDVSKNLEIFTTLYKELNLYYVDETNPGDLMKVGIDAMMKSLDPYTVYYPESRIEDARIENSGDFGGFGLTLKFSDDRVIIGEILQNYPADKEGLKSGDELITINSQSVYGLSEDELDGLLKGGVGSEAILMYKRKGEQNSVTLERVEVKMKEVPYFGMVSDKDGYVKLTTFNQTSSRSLKAAIGDLMNKQGAERLILDLRGNGGGLLREAVSIVNIFVPKGELVVSTKGKIESWNKVYETTVEPIAPDIPLVVLVDEKSASASEIVSGALQDLDRAVVIGRQSFGKGLVQQTKDLVYNSKMKLTIAKYYIPSGRCIQRLDYSNKVDGKANAVADSLIQPFQTRNGRPVYDGRGVDPDVEIVKTPKSALYKSLVENDIIFNYVNDYALGVQTPDTITEYAYNDYNSFKNYVMGQEFTYTTESEAQLEQLLEIAKKEKYYGVSEAEFNQLMSKLTPNKAEDLERYKSEISPVLESEIANRLYYKKGQIQSDLTKDPLIQSSIQTFDTNYSTILQ
ncbi:MAG: S41 family peptidase [Flavobacteriales bacterium]